MFDVVINIGSWSCFLFR